MKLQLIAAAPLPPSLAEAHEVDANGDQRGEVSWEYAPPPRRRRSILQRFFRPLRDLPPIVHVDAVELVDDDGAAVVRWKAGHSLVVGDSIRISVPRLPLKVTEPLT